MLVMLTRLAQSISYQRREHQRDAVQDSDQRLRAGEKGKPAVCTSSPWRIKGLGNVSNFQSWGSPGELPRFSYYQLFAGVVIARSRLQLLNVGRGQLRPVDGQGQLVEFAVEGEWDLIVLVVHWRSGVGADVEVLVPLHDQRYRVFHLLRGNGLAVNRQHAGAAAADATHVVEGERAGSEPVVPEVELE